jgi:hypothetical protein
MGRAICGCGEKLRSPLLANRRREVGRLRPVHMLGDGLLERLYGGGFVVFHVEDGVELGDLKQIVHFFG